MKKLVCLTCVFLLIAAMACAESLDLGAMSTEELTQLRDRISLELANRDAEARLGDYLAEFNGDAGFVGLTAVYRKIERSGRDILTLVFDYRNTTDKEQSVLTAIFPMVYVNGAKIDQAVVYHPNATSSLTTLQPGALDGGFEKSFELPESPGSTFTLVLYNGFNIRNPDKHTFELPIPEPD